MKTNSHKAHIFSVSLWSRALMIIMFALFLGTPSRAQADDITQALVATGGSIVSVSAIGVGSYYTIDALCDQDDPIDGAVCVVFALPVLATAMIGIVPLATWGGGELAGGDGSLLAAYGGMAVGILAASLIAVATPESDISYVVSAICFVAGPVIGYELSQNSDSNDGLEEQAQPMLYLFSIPF